MAIFEEEIREISEVEFIEDNPLYGRKYNWNLIKAVVKKCEHPEKYSLSTLPIEKYNFNVLFSRRNTGKTTTLLLTAIALKVLYGNISEYVRQRDDMLRASKLMTIFDTILELKLIQKLTNGKFNGIYYHWKYFYLVKNDENGNIIEKDAKPFLHCSALTEWAQLKSTYSNPTADLIIFDEFENKVNNVDEWAWLHQLISTFRRERLSCRVVMLGNTISPHNYYFREMCVNSIVAKMKPTDCYAYVTKKGTPIYLEYVEPISDAEKSEKRKINDYKYHGFSNLNSITGDGWDFDYYPHIKREYFKSENTHRLGRFYVDFNGLYLKCDFASTEEIGLCVFVQPTNYLPSDKLCFVQGRDLTTPYEVKGMGFTQGHKKIWGLFHQGKWLFSTNNEGSIVEQFINTEKTRLC